jgi:predicted RNA-binding protein with PIN domain
MEMPYLIDGNNLLGSWGGPSRGDDRRDDVVRRVAAFCRARNVKAILVFDGHPLRAGMASQDLGPVSIRVPPQGEDADSLIRELLERASRAADFIVVTSDKALGAAARELGASILRAHEWNALDRKLARPVESGEKPEHEDDVAGWLKTFGAEE